MSQESFDFGFSKTWCSSLNGKNHSDCVCLPGSKSKQVQIKAKELFQEFER